MSKFEGKGNARRSMCPNHLVATAIDWQRVLESYALVLRKTMLTITVRS